MYSMQMLLCFSLTSTNTPAAPTPHAPPPHTEAIAAPKSVQGLPCHQQPSQHSYRALVGDDGDPSAFLKRAAEDAKHARRLLKQLLAGGVGSHLPCEQHVWTAMFGGIGTRITRGWSEQSVCCMLMVVTKRQHPLQHHRQAWLW